MNSVDNLYLDMNGIVHFVIHGNTTDKIKKTTKKWNSGNPEEIFTEIFTYIDDIVHIVNPR
jgi:5'-3' exonuclease